MNNKNEGLSLNKPVLKKYKSEKDNFGFHTDFKRQLIRSNKKKNKLNKINYKKTILITFLVIFLVISFLTTTLSGYIAWNSFEGDPTWLKASKTGIAIFFSPIYLFYIFLKNIIFKLPQ